MSILRRIVLIVKGYLSSASETMDRVAAEEELREAQAKRRALEELRGAASEPTHAGAPSAPTIASALAADYRLLGVAAGSDLQTVEAAWRELARRADPKRFPAGSDEEKRAAEILRLVNDAYARIRESLNPTEGRFGRLEL